MSLSGLPLPGSPPRSYAPYQLGQPSASSPVFTPSTSPFTLSGLGETTAPTTYASGSPSAFELSGMTGNGGRGSPIGVTASSGYGDYGYGGYSPPSSMLAQGSLGGLSMPGSPPRFYGAAPWSSMLPVFHGGGGLPADIKVSPWASPAGSPEPGTSRAPSPFRLSPSLAPPPLAPSAERLYSELKNIDTGLEEILYDPIVGGRMADLSLEQINVIRVSLNDDQKRELKVVEDETPGITFVAALYNISGGDNAAVGRLTEAQKLSVLRGLTPEQAVAVYAEIRLHAAE